MYNKKAFYMEESLEKIHLFPFVKVIDENRTKENNAIYNMLCVQYIICRIYLICSIDNGMLA